ncbi:hypothetical protein E3N94_04365 [Cryobacterium sp. Sr3]|nr:hypothetical protein E3N94_04365 [Cryobacterium sp. Sr3]
MAASRCSGLRSLVLVALAFGLTVPVTGCVSAVPGKPPPSGNPAVREYVESALDFMDENGLYATRRKWKEARALASVSASSAETIAETHSPLMRAVSAAGGRAHSRFVLPPGQLGSVQLPPTGENRPVVSFATGSIAAIDVPWFSSSDTREGQSYIDAGARGISDAETRARCGWIVDLRGNGGGNSFPMLGAVTPLLSQGTVLSFIRRNGKSEVVRIDGSAVTYESDGSTETLATSPVTGSSQAGRNIAVLQGPETASAGESTLLAFRGQSGVRTFGETTTAGFATGNTLKTMSDGAVIVLTVARMADRTGLTYPDGIDPDQQTGAAALGEDPTWAGAIDWLNANCEHP